MSIQEIYSTENLVKKAIIDNGDGTTSINTNAKINVDTVNLSAEMKVDSGHDLYIATNVTRTADLAISFDNIPGLTIGEIQAVENKSKGWVYSTKGATVTGNSITLVAGSQSQGYPIIAIGDVVEVVYRGISRFDDKAKDSTLTNSTLMSNALGIYNSTDPSLTNGQKHQLRLNDKGELKVTGGASSVVAEYMSPSDFTAAFTSSTTITLSGLPLTVSTSAQVAYIKVIPVSGEAKTYVNGAQGVTLRISSNIITISGAGTPFASGDVYEVGLNSQRKAFDNSTNSTMVTNLNCISNKYVVDTLINTTNVAAATVYLPSSLGMSMDGFKDLCLSGRLIDADGTIDVTVEVSNNPDPSVGVFHQIHGYDSEANANVNTVGCNNSTKTFVWNFDNLNATWFRVKYVTSGATNTIGLFARRKA